MFLFSSLSYLLCFNFILDCRQIRRIFPQRTPTKVRHIRLSSHVWMMRVFFFSTFPSFSFLFYGKVAWMTKAQIQSRKTTVNYEVYKLHFKAYHNFISLLFLIKSPKGIKLNETKHKKNKLMTDISNLFCVLYLYYRSFRQTSKSVDSWLKLIRKCIFSHYMIHFLFQLYHHRMVQSLPLVVHFIFTQNYLSPSSCRFFIDTYTHAHTHMITYLSIFKLCNSKSFPLSWFCTHGNISIAYFSH